MQRNPLQRGKILWSQVERQKLRNAMENKIRKNLREKQ